ncbi:MAG: phosphoglycerate dehydrogenase [Lachnospiraceae bacterium]
MKKVLVSATNYPELCARGKKMLEEHGFTVSATTNGRPYTPEELKAMIGDFDAAVVGCDIWNEEIFKEGKKLKALARFGIGVDNIDLEAAGRHGIRVSNCVGINSNSVAEHAVTLMFAMNRLIPRLNNTTREGKWERVVVHEMNHYTVGLLGFGGIARKVAEKLNPFGARLIAYDVFPNEEEADKRKVELCDLETLLRESDIISIHVPAMAETLHIINRESIRLMKDGVYLVNTARGAVVDEKAAYEALLSGKIAAFASDVFEKDPVEPKNPLLSLDNFICTPHTAAESYENYELTGIETAQAIIDVFENRTPKNLLV